MKALLNETGVEYPHIHDPAPLLVEAIHARGLRGPAVYQEVMVTEAQAREAASAAARVLGFGRDRRARTRGS